MEQQIIYKLTAEGHKDLIKELKNLIEVRRPEIIDQIKAAREQGDLSENADYDTARAEQGKLEARIKEIQEIIDHAEIIKNPSLVKTAKKVKLGSSVTFKNLVTNEIATYKIVGEIEADPSNFTVSNESPLARVLLDKEEETIVEIRGIEQPYKIKIIEIK